MKKQEGHSLFTHSRPDASGLQGFCLFITFKIDLMDYRQKKPLKYYILPVFS